VRKLLAVSATALVVALGACSSADEDPTAEDDGAPTTTAEDETGGTSDEGTSDDTAGEGDGGSDDTSGDDEAGDDEPGADEEVLGTATARLPADPNDSTLVPLRLDVVALERLSGRVSMRALLTNEGASGSPEWEPYSAFDDPRLGAGQGTYSLSGASLVDGEAQQAYLTLVDSEGVCLCTSRLDTLAVPPGESVELYADFGGVPDDVERIDVVVPGFAAVTEVPIS
jgi:hypothetical protein